MRLLEARSRRVGEGGGCKAGTAAITCWPLQRSSSLGAASGLSLVLHFSSYYCFSVVVIATKIIARDGDLKFAMAVDAVMMALTL